VHKALIFLLIFFFAVVGRIYSNNVGHNSFESINPPQAAGYERGDNLLNISRQAVGNAPARDSKEREESGYVELVRNGAGRVYSIGAEKVPGKHKLSNGDRIEFLNDGSIRRGRMSGGKLILFGIPVDINSAAASDLIPISGIGPIKAKAIVRFREKRGGFESLDELKEVPGIGAKTLERIRPYLTCRR